MECTKCKSQYVGKAETELYLRINNYRKCNSSKSTFRTKRSQFQNWRKFSIIEQLQNAKLSKDNMIKMKKKRQWEPLDEKTRNSSSKRIYWLFNFTMTYHEHDLTMNIINWIEITYGFFPFNMILLPNAYRYQKSAK